MAENHKNDPKCQTVKFEKKAKDWDISEFNICGLYINPSLDGYFCIEHRPIEKIAELLENGKIVEAEELKTE